MAVGGTPEAEELQNKLQMRKKEKLPHLVLLSPQVLIPLSALPYYGSNLAHSSI